MKHQEKGDSLSLQIAEYLDFERPIYEDFARLMEAILIRVKGELSPQATVSTRVKQPDSFAEKILRRKKRYPYPCRDMGDLCGARIVIPTLNDMEPVCARIRELLVISEDGIEDKRALHKDTEFGYLSIHFKVGVDPDSLPDFLPEQARDWARRINGPDSSGTPFQRTAELQIRTALQDSWANANHDRIYKTPIRIPYDYRREAGRLAAILEMTDQRLADLTARIDAYSERYNAYMEQEEIRSEIDRLECIRTNSRIPDRDKLKLALRIARLARALGDWNQVIQIGRTYGTDNPEARVLLGEALCLKYSHSPTAPEFAEGLEHLASTIKDATTPAFEAEILGRLAWGKAKAGLIDPKGLKDLRHQAWMACPGNPYHFKEFLEAAILSEENLSAASILSLQIEKAIAACQEHVRVGIELPQAWFALGQLLLLKGDTESSLEAYLEGIALSGTNEGVEEEWESLKAMIERIPDLPAEFEHARDLLALAIMARQSRCTPGETAYELAEALGLDCSREKLTSPICILAGHGLDSDAFDGEFEILEQAFSGYQGAVISGGARSGLPGMLGDISDRLRRSSAYAMSTVGYLPKIIQDGVAEDNRYDRLVRSRKSRGFSFTEPIRYWADIIASGLNLESIRLLGMNGGRIAAFEYRLALALGATVGLVADSGRSADALLERRPDYGSLLRLPKDAASLWCFLRANRATEDLSAHEASGRAIHEVYRQTKYEHLLVANPVRQWEELASDLRQSNRHQASFAPVILEDNGFRLVPEDSPEPEAVFSEPEIETMGEKEHGRWCIERLMQGWSLGPTDERAKRNINLVPWQELDEAIRQYDLQTVRSWPQVIARTGQKIVRMP